jgi:hypothetical protein
LFSPFWLILPFKGKDKLSLESIFELSVSITTLLFTPTELIFRLSDVLYKDGIPVLRTKKEKSNGKKHFITPQFY